MKKNKNDWLFLFAMNNDNKNNPKTEYDQEN